jgi:excisionase family DNA binding protein
MPDDNTEKRPPTHDPEPTLRTTEAARALGVSSRALRMWADQGLVKCRRTFGGHRQFAVSEIERVQAHMEALGTKSNREHEVE